MAAFRGFQIQMKMVWRCKMRGITVEKLGFFQSHILFRLVHFRLEQNEITNL